MKKKKAVPDCNDKSVRQQFLCSSCCENTVGKVDTNSDEIPRAWEENCGS